MQPAIILVGAESGTQTDLVEALSQRGFFVETVPVHRAQKAAMLTAPDMAVLVDEAVADGGLGVLDQFAASPLSSVVPVVILEESPSADARVAAFRRGAAAVVHRSARTQDVAEELSETARRILARKNETYGELGEVTLREFLRALSHPLRDGPAVPRAVPSGESLPIAFAGGRPLAKLVDDYVQQVKQGVPHAQPLGFELGDGDAFARGWLAASASPQESTLTGLRVALADNDTARGASLARELQSRGATVIVTDLNPSAQRFARLRQLDPSVLVIGAEQLETDGYELVWRIQSDERLRWVTLLIVADGERLGPGPDQAVLIEQLALRLTVLIQPEHDLRARLFEGRGFDVRLESMGPARLLYALVDPPTPLHVRVTSPQLRVRIDISDRLLVGIVATVEREPVRYLEGIPALEAFLALSVGRIHIEPVRDAAAANVMTSVQDALTLADRDENARPAQQPPTKAQVVGQAIVMATPEPSSDADAPPLPATVMSAGNGLESRPDERQRSVSHGAETATAESHLEGLALSRLPDDPDAAAPAQEAANLPDSRDAWARVDDGSVTSSGSGGDQTPCPRGGRGRSLAIVAAVSALVGCAAVLLSAGTGGWARSWLPRVGSGADRVVPRATSANANANARSTSMPAPGKAAPLVDAGPPEPSPERSPESGEEYRIARASESGPLPVVHPGNHPTPSCADLLQDVVDARAEETADVFDLILQGRRLLVLGDAEEAQRTYCQALSLEPHNATAQAEFARLLLVRRDGVAGLREIDRALQIDPSSRVLHGVRGDALARLGRYEEARAEWFAEARLQAGTRSEERALRTAMLRASRGHLGRHAWGEAERFCRRTIVLDQESLEASMCLARALVALGDPDEARMWARYARKLAPRSARVAAMVRSLGDEP